MKKTTWVCGIALAGLVALTGPGCKKNDMPPGAPTINGVKVDFPKLQQAFAGTANPEIQKTITQVSYGLRYGKPLDAMMALDKLSSDASLTDAQKKVVGEVMDQVKQLAAAQGAPAAPPAQ